MEFIEKIDIEAPEKYNLLIRITSDVLSYYIYQSDSESKTYYGEVPLSSDTGELLDIEQMIYEADFFTHPYKLVNVVFVSKDYDLIPAYIIQSEKKEILYNFTHYKPAEEILYSPIQVQQISTVFNVKPEMYKFLARSLNAAQFHHHSSLLLQYLEQLNKKNGSAAKMYLHFHKEFVDVFCYDKLSRIIHVITFEKETSRNLIYYILSIWNKCNFDQNLDYLYILDNIEKENIYISSILHDYIRNIERLDVLTDLGIDTLTENQSGMNELPLDLLILSTK